jgi:hypothetical protein
MVYEGVSFHEKWAGSISKKEFIEFPGNQLLWPNDDSKERRSKLGLVWDMIQNKKKNAYRQQPVTSKPKD